MSEAPVKRERSPAALDGEIPAESSPDAKSIARGGMHDAHPAGRAGVAATDSNSRRFPVIRGTAPDRFTGSMLGSGIGGILAADGGPLDPRLRCFSAAMFYGKRVLHIGCGSGNSTIAIAELFRPARILGIDTHRLKLRKARAALRARSTAAALAARALPANSDSAASSTHPLDAPLSARLQRPAAKRSVDIPSVSSASAEASTPFDIGGADSATLKLAAHVPRFPHNIGFREEDASAEELVASHGLGSYDVVLCFGVTMETHLTGGDDALDGLINRICRLLAPGGVLVMEPRTWKDYKRKQGRMSRGAAAAGVLAVRPIRVPELLVTRHGFRQCAWLTPQALSQAALSGVVEPSEASGQFHSRGYDGPRGAGRAGMTRSSGIERSEQAESSRRRPEAGSDHDTSRPWARGQQERGVAVGYSGDNPSWGAGAEASQPRQTAAERRVRRLLIAYR